MKYYRTTIETMELASDKSIRHIQTEDLRSYLTGYQSKNQSSRVTIDNIRRILSSFFSWLEDEDYILKSPVRRIHKVKTATNIKETYTDEELEKMRDNCTELRDLAIIDMLASTGMRRCGSFAKRKGYCMSGMMIPSNARSTIRLSWSIIFSTKRLSLGQNAEEQVIKTI